MCIGLWGASSNANERMLLQLCRTRDSNTWGACWRRAHWGNLCVFMIPLSFASSNFLAFLMSSFYYCKFQCKKCCMNFLFWHLSKVNVLVLLLFRFILITNTWALGEMIVGPHVCMSRMLSHPSHIPSTFDCVPSWCLLLVLIFTSPDYPISNFFLVFL